MKYDIILIGNYTKDTVVTPTETKYVDGGGFNYGAHAAVALGAKTGAITRLKKDDQHRKFMENHENCEHLQKM